MKKAINKQKLLQIIALLKFIVDLDDLEVVRSTINSIVEQLEEDVK